ncbi:putative ubiquitin carboxyl-terminal hydrolase 3 [Leucoagaricus sp. SymC.cos]|nr:putative ubiquitin carboxyl-terminal hydrolase 3 [Leucoagaricus sp. SymC.cos]
MIDLSLLSFALIFFSLAVICCLWFVTGVQDSQLEELLEFYLDTVDEEELLHIQISLTPPPPLPPTNKQSTAMEEKEPPEEDRWPEVDKKNKAIVTRTIKAVESPTTRIFGGKLKSTLKAPGQEDWVLVEDWRSFRLDI